jgi:ubiquinone/menaquinone biosynthesis C-methylase UbiE
MNIFNRFANRYNNFVGPFNLDEIIEYLPLKEKALLIDLGGGTGRIAYQLAEHVSECLIFDSSYEMLQQAQKNDIFLPCIQGLSESSPFKSESIDQIFLNDSLHHIQKYEETLIECHRILVPDGDLVIREFDKKYFWNKFLILLEFLVGFKSKFFSPQELAKLCRETGFSVQWKRPTKATFILLAKKKSGFNDNYIRKK